MTWKAAVEEDAPLSERISTMTNQRRENKKTIAARLRKGRCAKRAFSRKQALTARASSLNTGKAAFLRIYKCPRCGWWHLTHKPDRRKTV